MFGIIVTGFAIVGVVSVLPKKTKESISLFVKDVFTSGKAKR